MKNFRKLSDDELISELKSTVSREREAIQDVLHLLHEVDRRDLHLRRGFPDLFSFLIEELKYSRGSAYRRVQAMRAIRELGSKLEEDLISDRISLNTVCQIQSLSQREPSIGLEKKRELLEELQGKTSDEVQKRLVEISPHAIPRERAKVLTPELVKLELVVSHEFLSELEELRDLLSHQLKDPNSKFELLQKLAEISMNQLTRHRGRLEQKHGVDPVSWTG